LFVFVVCGAREQRVTKDPNDCNAILALTRFQCNFANKASVGILQGGQPTSLAILALAQGCSRPPQPTKKNEHDQLGKNVKTVHNQQRDVSVL
jgi:hypothetical protein